MGLGLNLSAVSASKHKLLANMRSVPGSESSASANILQLGVGVSGDSVHATVVTTMLLEETTN